MRIIIIDKKENFTKDQISQLNKSGEVEFANSIEEVTKKSDLKDTNSDKSVLLALNPDVTGWSINNSDLENVPNLKYISLQTTSAEMLDQKYCKKNKIQILNIPNYSTEAVAEYAIWMMLSLVRKLPLMLSGEIKSFDGSLLQTEVKGKVAGIIGMGNIGTRIAEFCDRMGMKVIYYSRSQKDNFYERRTLKNVLKNADFIFPCYTVNEKTKNLLNKDNLKLMKKDAHLISIIGGSEALDVKYVSKAVAKGLIAGFAYENDGENRENERKNVNVFTPPPLAWYSKESLERCYKEWVDCICLASRGILLNLAAS